jgi:hypothetical protein
MRTEQIEFHIVQAHKYNLAIADPHVTEWDMARKAREFATYHLDMADWYMAEPKPPVTALVHKEEIESVRAEVDQRTVEEVQADEESDGRGSDSPSGGREPTNEEN